MFEGLFRGEHLLLILLVVILLFPAKLAGLGGSLGKSIRDFKKALNDPTSDAGGPVSPPQAPEKKEG